MKSKTISNSKYRNTGVLFELLVRQVTSDTLVNKPVSEALNLMKKYFNASTELGKELQLYRAFFETKPLSEVRAIHFIELVAIQHRKLDERKLAREKYELIKEVKTHYSLKDFLSAKIPNYTVYASIYKTLTTESAKKNAFNITNIHDIANARFTLIEQLTGKMIKKQLVKEDNKMLEEFRQQSDDLRLLAYKFVIDRFNTKYSNLNDKQKNLLREFINNVTDTNSLVEYIRTEVPLVKANLLKCAAASKEQVVKIKLNEIAANISRIGQSRIIKDTEVTALLIAYEILKEVSND
jgi:hypothetical protein